MFKWVETRNSQKNIKASGFHILQFDKADDIFKGKKKRSKSLPTTKCKIS